MITPTSPCTASHRLYAAAEPLTPTSCQYDEKSDQAMTIGANIAHDFVLHTDKK